jgi:hypothetical protein
MTLNWLVGFTGMTSVFSLFAFFNPARSFRTAWLPCPRIGKAPASPVETAENVNGVLIYATN